MYCSMTEIRQETHWIVNTTGWFNLPSWKHTTRSLFARKRGLVPQGTQHYKNNTEQMEPTFRLGLPYGNPVTRRSTTRPSVRVHWVACGTCTVPDNFFQVGGSLRPFKGSPRRHTSRSPLAHRSSHVRTTKQICPCVICSPNSAQYCFGIVYHCTAM